MISHTLQKDAFSRIIDTGQHFTGWTQQAIDDALLIANDPQTTPELSAACMDYMEQLAAMIGAIERVSKLSEQSQTETAEYHAERIKAAVDYFSALEATVTGAEAIQELKRHEIAAEIRPTDRAIIEIETGDKIADADEHGEYAGSDIVEFLGY